MSIRCIGECKASSFSHKTSNFDEREEGGAARVSLWR